MANVKISALPAAAVLTGTEEIPVVQSAATVKATAQDIADLVDLSTKADLASPTFTGTPAAPTAAPGTNTTQISTTAFVTAAIAASPGLLHFTEANSATGVNAPSPVKSFTAIEAGADADVAIIPKAAGAILSRIPDGTNTGGNKRGIYAVDFQRVSYLANEVAAGGASVIAGGQGNRTAGDWTAAISGRENYATVQYAFIGGGYFNRASSGSTVVVGGQSNTASADSAAILGGQSNTASGTYSTVLAGYQNIASGSYGIAMGLASNTRGLYGAKAWAVGSWSANGQKLDMLLRKTTTDATVTSLTADGGAASATNQMAFGNREGILAKGMVIAAEAATQDTKSWTFEAMCKVDGAGAITLVGTPIINVIGYTGAGSLAWDCTVVVDATNVALSVRGQGEAAKTIKWFCNMSIIYIPTV